MSQNVHVATWTHGAATVRIEFAPSGRYLWTVDVAGHTVGSGNELMIGFASRAATACAMEVPAAAVTSVRWEYEGHGVFVGYAQDGRAVAQICEGKERGQIDWSILESTSSSTRVLSRGSTSHRVGEFAKAAAEIQAQLEPKIIAGVTQ